VLDLLPAQERVQAADAKAMAMTLDAHGIRLFDYAKQFAEPLRERRR